MYSSLKMLYKKCDFSKTYRNVTVKLKLSVIDNAVKAMGKTLFSE